MIASKGSGHTICSESYRKFGASYLIVIFQDAFLWARDVSFTYAAEIGGVHIGVLKTIFRFETETDLFGERAALYGRICNHDDC